jgi:hypothetical protein
MNVEDITLEDFEVLKHAVSGCFCESYYRYQCVKCKASAGGFLTSKSDSVDKLKNDNLVYFADYGGLKATQMGLSMYVNILTMMSNFKK